MKLNPQGFVRSHCLTVLSSSFSLFWVLAWSLHAQTGVTPAEITRPLSLLGNNFPPTIFAVSDQTIVENTTLVLTNITIFDTETATTNLTPRARASNTNLVHNEDITLTHRSGITWRLSITPASNRFGVTTITIAVTDPVTLQSRSSTFQLTVTPAVLTGMPAVRLASPRTNETFLVGADVLLEADALDVSGAVARVQFFWGANLLGEATTPPYRFTWRVPAVANYEMWAKAINDRGLTNASDRVPLRVRPLPVPFFTQRAVNEGETVEILVPGGNPDHETTLSYTTLNEVAIGGSDYGPDFNQIVWPPGEPTTAKITLQTLRDDVFDPGETFLVRFRNPSTGLPALYPDIRVSIVETNGPPVVFLKEAEVRKEEGNGGETQVSSLFFTLGLSMPSEIPITVEFVLTNGTATAGQDYVWFGGFPDAVSFLPRMTETKIRVRIIGDVTDEEEEDLFVKLIDAAPALIDETRSVGRALILDDDDPPVASIRNAVPVKEGASGTMTNAMFAVTLSEASAKPVIVRYVTAEGTAQAGADYLAITNGSVRIQPGNTSTNVTVTVLGDALSEPDETFFVDLTVANNASINTNKSRGQATILDDDALPEISIFGLSVSEGITTNLVVTLSTPHSQPVTVGFATTNGTAFADVDYLTVTNRLTFSPGETNKSIALFIKSDLLDEPEETFLVTLFNPTNAVIALGREQATIVIVDDNLPPLLSIQNVTVNEGNSELTNAIFFVILSTPSGYTVTVDYMMTNETAVSGIDYQAIPGRLVFNPGETNKTVITDIVGDSLNESNETFLVNLFNATNATIAVIRAKGTIIDDDLPPALSIQAVAVMEGNAGTTNALFSVNLSAVSGQAASVNFATTNGTAQADLDYVPTSGTLTFNPGETNKTISVQVIGDTLIEGDEFFLVNLRNLTNAIPSVTQARGTISNDEQPPVLTINEITVREEGSVPALFQVSLSAPTTETVTVDFATTNDTAFAELDYRAQTGRLTFNPAETNKTIAIIVIGDALDEPDETFLVNLLNPSNANLGPSQGRATILDGNPSSVLSIQDASVGEGNSGTTNAVFFVTLAPASGQIVTVDFASTNGTAQAGNDFIPNSGKLVFNPGETNKSIVVSIVGDTLIETNETFLVLLSKPTNAGLTEPQAQGTILDDEQPPELAVNDVVLTEGNEGLADAVFTVSLSEPTTQTVTVAFVTRGETATAQNDFVPQFAPLVFKPGETNKSVTVQVISDKANEPDERFSALLANPVNATIGKGQGSGSIINDDELPILSAGALSVTEGNTGSVSVVVPVNLSPLSGQTVIVDVVTKDGTAEVGSDYLASTNTLTFNPGDVSKAITVVVNGDLLDEENETILIQLLNPQNATAPEPGLLTIVNDDQLPAIAINDVRIEEGQAGSTNASFNVSLSSPSGRRVSVDFATINGSATAGVDYEADSGPLIFLSGETNKVVTVRVNGDSVKENDETFVVNLTNPKNASLGRREGQGTILDDDPLPTISIDDISVTERNDGLSKAVFTIALSTKTDQSVTVDFSTADGTALAGSDYLNGSGALTFNSGETSKTIEVLVIGDLLDEPDENFLLNLSNAKNASLADAQGRAEIADDDATPTLSLDDVRVDEGNSGFSRAVFRAILSNPSGQKVEVDYAVGGGTAVPDEDYVGNVGTLTFNPGETDKTITVIVLGNAINQPNRTFFVNLSNTRNAILLRPQVTGTIVDDDALPVLTITDASVTEGHSGTNVIFQARLSERSSQIVTVTVATADGTATASSDYERLPPTTLTFNPEEIEKTINVAIRGDTLHEPEETFLILLTEPKNALLLDDQAIGTITDDDAPVGISISDAAVTEGDGGAVNATFTVSLSTPSEQTVTVNYETADDSASAATDYVRTSGTLTFSPGSMTETFIVPTKGDLLDEEEERFWVNLSTPVNAVILDGQGVGTISDNDPLPEISIEDVSLAEGLPLVFSVRLSAPSSRIVTVQYATTNGTATAAIDYGTSLGKVTFPPGETNQTITVLTMDDVLDEPVETFLIRLTDPANAIIRDGEGVGSILNNDGIPVISIKGVTISEGDSGTVNAVFSVTLSRSSARTVSVNFATVPGTATSPEDFRAGFGTLIFPPETIEQKVVVAVNGDRMDEPNETFFVDLSSPIGAVLGNSRGVGNIIDDDVEPTVSITDAATTEGNVGTNQVVFTVRLSVASLQTVTVNFTTVDGSAVAGSDYVRTAGTLTFLTGTLTNTVTVPVTGDTLHESNETFEVRLSEPKNAKLADEMGIGTIVDDDVPPTLAITDAVVSERNSGTTNAVFTVRLSSPSSQTVAVDFQTSNGTASAGSDYLPASGKVTFPPGTVTQTISVEVLGDMLVENNETFFVTLTLPLNASLTDNLGLGTILNDDAVTNQPPTVQIIAPANGAAFTAPAEVTITANAQDADGKVQRVDFFVGSVLLGSAVAPPFSLTWPNEASGAYTLTATAVDNQGATVTSSPVNILVSRNVVASDVAIVRNFAHPEITQLQDLLLDLNVSSQVFDQEGLTFEALQDYKLLIWNDLGATESGLTENDVKVFRQALDYEIPLFFMGSALAASAQNLSASLRTQWLNLIHLRSSGTPSGSGAITLDQSTGHAVLNGHFGTLVDFGYSANFESVFQPASGAMVLGRSGAADVLVAFENENSMTGTRTLTQGFLVTDGSEARSLTERKRLFKNSISWLLRKDFQSLTDLSITLLGSDKTTTVGQPLTFSATISHQGEIAGSGVTVTIPLPSNLKFVSASFIQGSVSEADGVLIYHVGNMESAQQTTFSFVLTPTTPGNITIQASVSGNEADPNLLNNSASVDLAALPDPFATAKLTLQSLDNRSLRLLLSGAPSRIYRLQTSTNLVHWLNVTNLNGASSMLILEGPAKSKIEKAFYRVISP